MMYYHHSKCRTQEQTVNRIRPRGLLEHPDDKIIININTEKSSITITSLVFSAYPIFQFT